jgi:ubiquinone/menaquinone biosynthesis C-methylase UbiE
MDSLDMAPYFSGEKLYGDDFTIEQIEQWYHEEAEGYANLGSKNIETYNYGYHEMNRVHGFSKIKGQQFEKVLGIGSAWGHEFMPVLSQIKKLTILEPSDNMVSTHLGGLIPDYVKPSISGQLPFEDNSFNLITSFGSLHHIPNVTYVLEEMIRVLQPGGYILIREPMISMGDWRKKRRGLTKNERGIAVSHFDGIFAKHPVEVVSKAYCFTATPLFHRLLKPFLKKAIYSYRSYVVFDKYLSALLKLNVRYHAVRKINKIAPQSVFYVVRKTN